MEETPDPKFLAVYDGVVVDRVDPLKIGRVRVTVAGIIDYPGVWALPMGTGGGGSTARGLFSIPEDGAEVSIFFKMGDADRPRYLAGPWGAPEGVPEIPTAAQGLTPEQTPNVRVFESRRYELVMDDNAGRERLSIRDKLAPEGGEDIIELDGVANGVVVRGTAGVVIESVGAVAINALSVTINGRPVRDTDDPI